MNKFYKKLFKSKTQKPFKNEATNALDLLWIYNHIAKFRFALSELD